MDPIFRDISDEIIDIKKYIIKYKIPLGSILYVNFKKKEYIIVNNLSNDGKYIRNRKNIDLIISSPITHILIRKKIKYKKIIEYINSYEKYNFLINEEDIKKLIDLGLYD